VISVHEGDQAGALGDLVGFRREFYACLTARADALFELCDAVLCADGPVTSLVELSQSAVHRRGHGALYDALAQGKLTIARFEQVLAGLALPRFSARRLVVGVDITAWPRPDADCSPERVHCHQPCRCDGDRQTVGGWSYSLIAALGPGRSSWTAPLDIVRIGPTDDVTQVTAAQIRGLVARLVTAGQHTETDPPILIVLDAGYDIVRLTWLLADLPVVLLGRVRANRVMHGPPASRRAGGRGPAPRHGDRFAFTDPATWRRHDQDTVAGSDRYGIVHARSWSWLHPVLQGRDAWAEHAGLLPIVEGTIIRLSVQHLPGNRKPDPLWLWCGDPHLLFTAELDLLWQCYLRRFDLEHTFRFFKQTLGFTRPRIRTPQQADRWAWLILAAYTQLRLARGLTTDLRRPWEKPLDPERMTPGRVRRGFTHLRRTTGSPARVPSYSRPGPGRPKGTRSEPAPRHPIHTKPTKPTKTNKPKRVRKKQKG
jgi:DDE superfamily endonuclease